ncbi:MAG: TetR/AcrR family transcriptional regulator [Anaerolineae bacterium]
MDDKSYLRRIPRQKRSLERFNHILDAADGLFAQHGIEAVSTNHIAEAAGVAIGSLYQFFPDRDAVLRALVDRYLTQLAGVFPSDVAPPRPIPDIIGEMLTNIAQFRAGAFERLMMENDEAVGAMHTQITDWVDGMLAAQHPALDPERRRICAMTGVAMMKGLLTLPMEIVQTEAPAALISYLTDFLRREGV